MKRKKVVLSAGPWQKKLPSLANRQPHFVFLHSNQNEDKYGAYDWICAFGLKPESQIVYTLQQLEAIEQDWHFGHVSYELKNQMEALHSNNKDVFAWPDISFFCPDTVVHSKNGVVVIESFSLFDEEGLRALLSMETSFHPLKSALKPNLTEEGYLEKGKFLMDQLLHGNIYEVNFCMEYAGVEEIDPVAYFNRLNVEHKAPFSAFYRLDENYLLCFSPERYLRKTSGKLLSQPIKGTAPRGLERAKDEAFKKELKASEKERAENVMIVDLVRNDLSRIAKQGSVKVDELFGIYSYPSVHQMVSTISCTLKDQLAFADCIKATFPMGSMTGAPKISAMQIIDETEDFARSLYSGSVGYISPQGDFDFNVVIRSLLYNQDSKHISLRVGSAITAYCDLEKEYEECQLKAQKILNTIHATES